MYVIITYDVNVKRVNKVCKKLREYLTWSQNSVFEGGITLGALKKCLAQLEGIIDKQEDSIYLYKIKNPRHLEKQVYGKNMIKDTMFL